MCKNHTKLDMLDELLDSVKTVPLNNYPLKYKLEITGNAVLAVFVAAMLQQSQQFKVTPTNRSQICWLEFQGFHSQGVCDALIKAYAESVEVLAGKNEVAHG